MNWFRLTGIAIVGAALAAPALAQQTVPVDPNGYSPYNTKATLNENVQSSSTRNAPAFSLPSIYGLNPCSLGASVGVSTPLFGVGGAISTTDKDCEIRNTAALTITGLKDVALAREIMCEIPQFREASARIGEPCLEDRKVTKTHQPTAATAARVTEPTEPRAKTVVASTPPRPPPKWCRSANTAEHIQTLSPGTRQYVHMKCGPIQG